MDVHPIEHCPPLTDKERLSILEYRLAQLWDEVWWHQLPWYKRWYYKFQGFKSPISNFYKVD